MLVVLLRLCKVNKLQDCVAIKPVAGAALIKILFGVKAGVVTVRAWVKVVMGGLAGDCKATEIVAAEAVDFL